MRHSLRDFELDLTPGGTHPFRHAQGIIEQNFVASDLNERRRKSSGVAVKRGGVGRPRVDAGKIAASQPGGLIAAQHRINFSIATQ
jgi:hypothetical protein